MDSAFEPDSFASNLAVYLDKRVLAWISPMMKSNDHTIPEILRENYEVDGFEETVYQIGCRASLLTVHAQQRRAFQLAWLLKEANKINTKSRIAIIGGGISGITAALALHALGSHVFIFESAKEIMHLQRRNITRLLHPNLYIWPKQGFDYPITHMPFLNWQAGAAGQVAQQLQAQWNRFAKTFKKRIVFGCKIESIRLNDRDLPVLSFSDGRSDASFNLVVIAVGYGLESPRHSMTPSYWRNDDLEQILFPNQGTSILVSGSGDGGLTEVLRLSFLDFEHKSFLHDVARNNSLKRMATEARSILRFATDREKAAYWKSFIANDTARKPEFLAKDRIRRDVSVILNSTRSCPFLSEAQLLHQLLVALLLRHNIIEHVAGKLVGVGESKGLGKFVVALRKQRSKQNAYLLVDRVIERHKSDPSYGNLFDKESTVDTTTIRSQRTPPLLKVGFLADEFMGSHDERSYEFGVNLLPKDDWLSCANSVLQGIKVDLSGLEGTQFLDVSFDFMGRRFQLSAVRDGGMRTLILKTDSRALLERILYRQRRKYAYLKIFGAWTQDPTNLEDKVFDMGSIRYFPKEKAVTITSSSGLGEAYRLLRMPVLIEILSSKWSTKKLNGWMRASTLDRRELWANGNATELLGWD